MCFLSEKCVFPARIRHRVLSLCSQCCVSVGLFPLISSCVDCSASLSSSAFLEFPPSSCCRCRYILGISAFFLLSSSSLPSWGFRLVPQARLPTQSSSNVVFWGEMLTSKGNFHFPEIVARLCSSSSSSSFF